MNQGLVSISSGIGGRFVHELKYPYSDLDGALGDGSHTVLFRFLPEEMEET